MLLTKSFAVPVEPVVKPAEVITSEKPFFDPGAGTSQKSTGVSDVSVTGPSPVQATRELPIMKATQPVEAPGTRRGVLIQHATQPFEAPSAGTATQPVEAPGTGPEVLLTTTVMQLCMLTRPLLVERLLRVPVDILRRWERAAREQTVMCKQAADLSRCRTRVQDVMFTQDPAFR